MRDAAYYRRQAEALYKLSHSRRGGMERLAFVLQAIEYEARATDLERGEQPRDLDRKGP